MTTILGSNLLISFLLSFFIHYGFSLDATDTWRDADIQQSSYIGGNNNMDPSVVGSSQFGVLWKIATNENELFYAKPLIYTPTGGTQLLFMASSQNIIRTFDAKTGVLINSRQLHTPFLQSDIGCTDMPNTIGYGGNKFYLQTI